METRLFLWTSATPGRWDRAEFTYRAMSPKGKLSPIKSSETPEANQEAATLEALVACLKEFSGGRRWEACVVCSCPAVINSINQGFMRRWENNGYLTARGRPVKHADLWRQVGDLCRDKQIELTSRPPDSTETEIMHEMGAEYLNPRIPVKYVDGGHFAHGKWLKMAIKI